MKKLDLKKLQPLTAKSKEWFKKQLPSLKRFDGINSQNLNKIKDILKDNKQTISAERFTIGKMYFYLYNAKWKKILPYWDRLPLVIPVERYHNGFLGINFHYLPPIYRARLLNALLNVANNNKMDETTKLRVSYEILKNVSKYNLIKPCLKRYLFSHIESRIVKISAKEWNYVIYLPLARFKKKPQNIVWKESLKEANGNS